MGKLTPSESLWIYSMGKRFPITGLFCTESEANQHCKNHRNDAVIACIQGIVFTAEKYSGTKDLDKPEAPVAKV